MCRDTVLNWTYAQAYEYESLQEASAQNLLQSTENKCMYLLTIIKQICKDLFRKIKNVGVKTDEHLKLVADIIVENRSQNSFEYFCHNWICNTVAYACS